METRPPGRVPTATGVAAPVAQKIYTNNPYNSSTHMAYNEVLLVKPVDGLGGEGDQVRVRAGLCAQLSPPRSIAVPVTTANRTGSTR